MNIQSAASMEKGSSTARDNRILKKVTRPSLECTYRRAELHRVLDDLATTPLIVVNSWSGSGKTTFLADYAESRHSVCLWYRAERNDDIASFLYSLIVSASESHLLQHEYEAYWALDEIDAGNLMTVREFFVNLFRQINLPLLIVIDDFQEARFQDTFHEILRIACLELPKGGRIVVANSGKSRLNLAKLRKAFPVALLEDQDFVLSVNEVREIAELYGRPVMSPFEANQLWTKVDGCASCLMMMLNDERSRTAESS